MPPVGVLVPQGGAELPAPAPAPVPRLFPFPAHSPFFARPGVTVSSAFRGEEGGAASEDGQLTLERVNSDTCAKK